MNDLKVRDLDELNKLIRRIKKHKGPGIVHRVLRGKLVVVTFGDSCLDPAGERIYQGTAVFLCETGADGRVDLEQLEEAVMRGNYLLSTSRKSTKALTSSLSGEVHGAVAAFDHGLRRRERAQEGGARAAAREPRRGHAVPRVGREPCEAPVAGLFAGCRSSGLLLSERPQGGHSARPAQLSIYRACPAGRSGPDRER